MTTAAPPSSRPWVVAKFDNGAEWLHALGDIPLERVVMDPPPGTATEQDLLWSGTNGRSSVVSGRVLVPWMSRPFKTIFVWSETLSCKFFEP